MSPRKWIILVIGLLVIAVAYAYLNRGYGKIGQHGYQIAMALFSACNQHDSSKLEMLDQLVSSNRDSGQLTARESRWLQGVIRLGLQGKWDAANREIRRLMEDQIQTASPLPADHLNGDD